MKKPLLLTLAVVLLLAIAGVLLFVTHTLEWYTISTTSNQPTYKTGDLVFASSLKKPGNGDFIVFEREKNIWIFRCIGKPGDKVEIKKADVYVNGKLLEEPYTMKRYYIPTKDALRLEKFLLDNDLAPREIYYGLAMVPMSDAQLKAIKLPLKRFSKEKDADPVAGLFKQFKQKHYNEDNLGPIVVPANSYFVLGDSRSDAFDSRFFGYVKAKDIISTVVK